jgi:EmrB/QacA subfamily drug resistance transporter
MAEVDPRKRWLTLAAMCFALFMIMLDNTVVNVALPAIQRDLNPSPANLEWTVNAYVLTFAALILLGGALGDRFGRKRCFLFGLILFTFASEACALATTDTQLIAARAVQGAGAAFMSPLSLSIITVAFPRRQLPTAIGIWAGVSALGLAIGPLVGGFLVEHQGWSAVFWINVPIGALASSVAWIAVDESRDPGARSLDPIGTALVTAGLFALTYGVVTTNSHSWTSHSTVLWLGAAGLLLDAFVAWEAWTPNPMLPLSFFRERAFAASAAVMSLVGLSLFGSIYFITLFLQNVQGDSAIEAGVRTLPTTLTIVALGPFAGRVGLLVGPRLQLGAGMLSIAAALFGLAHVGIDTEYAVLAPFFVLLGIGVAFTLPGATSAALGAVDHARAGIASGVVNATRQVGGALGIAIMGSVGATLTASRFHEQVAGAGQLDPLVVGGRASLITDPRLHHAALDSFVHGVRGAMLTASLLALAGAGIALVGLAGARRSAPQGAHAAVEV